MYTSFWVLGVIYFLLSDAPDSNIFPDRGDEIGRRGGLFYVGLTLGTLTAGLIQSGASANLEGVNGLSGWR